MCGPTVPWDWFILDFAFVLVLLGGALIFRAKGSEIATWVSFGLLSTCVGAFLFYFTWEAQTALGSSATMQSAATLLASC